jgi:hypothetical protein
MSAESLLEFNIAHSENFIHEQDVRVDVRGNGEA